MHAVELQARAIALPDRDQRKPLARQPPFEGLVARATPLGLAHEGWPHVVLRGDDPDCHPGYISSALWTPTKNLEAAFDRPKAIWRSVAAEVAAQLTQTRRLDVLGERAGCGRPRRPRRRAQIRVGICDPRRDPLWIAEEGVPWGGEPPRHRANSDPESSQGGGGADAGCGMCWPTLAAECAGLRMAGLARHFMPFMPCMADSVVPRRQRHTHETRRHCCARSYDSRHSATSMQSHMAESLPAVSHTSSFQRHASVRHAVCQSLPLHALANTCFSQHRKCSAYSSSE